jgi:hypothetical protein
LSQQGNQKQTPKTRASNMLRKIFFATITTLGLALPLGLNSTAQAYPPTVVYAYPPPVVYAYPPPVVYYGPAYTVMYYGAHHHWHCYGTYASRWDAEHAARHLRHDGFAVRIEVR